MSLRSKHPSLPYIALIGFIGVILLGSVFIAPALSDGDPIQEEPVTNSEPPKIVPQRPMDNPYQDPDTDVIGWEGGYWYDENPAILWSRQSNASEGYTEEELKKIVSLYQARIEYMRQLEYTDPVTVEVITRDEFRANNVFDTPVSKNYSDWNNQVWEALFLTGEQTNVTEELGNAYGGSVTGYYDVNTEKLVIITNPETPNSVDYDTLVHELVHSLQHQNFNLSRDYIPTQDSQLAYNGVVEGDAMAIEQSYKRHCERGTWGCFERAQPSPSRAEMHAGIHLILYQPYNDGPGYIEHLREEGGWEYVNFKLQHPPKKTREIIHPGDASPLASFTDPAVTEEWSVYASEGKDGSDSVGEASLFVMFWYQSYAHAIPVVSKYAIYNSDSDAHYSYTSSITDGLTGDRVTPYKSDTGEFGYTWELVWDSSADAKEFTKAYTEVLEGHGGVQNSRSTWVIPSGEFADAFWIYQDGHRVVIVNGPTIEAVDELKPPKYENR